MAKSNEQSNVIMAGEFFTELFSCGHSSSSSSTSTTAAAAYEEKRKAEEREEAQALQRITAAAEATGLRATQRVLQTLARYLREGFEVEMIVATIEETAMAPRPSWRYAFAILRNCYNEGVKTQAAFFARQLKWDQERGWI